MLDNNKRMVSQKNFSVKKQPSEFEPGAVDESELFLPKLLEGEIPFDGQPVRLHEDDLNYWESIGIVAPF